MYKARILRGVVFLLILLKPLSIQAQFDATNADIFFLDLGIVIEPRTGKEVYNRLVNPSSEEVKLRIKKVESGSVYMATSKEMLNALQRIQQRMDVLEKSFQTQISVLRAENQELKGMLTEIKSKPTSVPVSNITAVTLPKAEPDVPKIDPQPSPKTLDVAEQSTPSLIETSPAPHTKIPPPKVKKPSLNYSEYMAAIFAYQREDYREALKHFEKLDLSTATPEMAANILYWSADAHNQLGETYQALSLLDELLSKHIQSDRVDDALVQKGLLYRKTGQKELALAAFTRLVQEFPSSEYSRLASMELKKADIIP